MVMPVHTPREEPGGGGRGKGERCRVVFQRLRWLCFLTEGQLSMELAEARAGGLVATSRVSGG